jgi:hypothetical protein
VHARTVRRRRWVGIAAICVATHLGCGETPVQVDERELERQQEETMKVVREQERLERLEQQKAKAAEKRGAKP